MRDKNSVQYAEQRAARATARARRHATAAQRAEDAADAAQSKGWRTRRLREAARALRLMRKAASEAKSWQAKAQTRRAAKAAAPQRRAPRGAPSAPSAYEFVMAVNYREQSTPQASHVDIQMHVRREDGNAMTEREARAVFTEMRDTGVQTIPVGYEVAAVDWKRARATRWRSGNVDEALGNFYSILLTVDPNKYDFRLGGLKE